MKGEATKDQIAIQPEEPESMSYAGAQNGAVFTVQSF